MSVRNQYFPYFATTESRQITANNTMWEGDDPAPTPPPMFKVVHFRDPCPFAYGPSGPTCPNFHIILPKV